MSSPRDEQRQEVEQAKLDLVCKCGHPRDKHVFLRARCAENCGCVRYEPKAKATILGTALSLDEQLELANKEIGRLRMLNRVLLDEQAPDVEKIIRQNEKLREGIRVMVGDPTSTRADVQARLLGLMGDL